jgi:hypothetical protein
LIIQSNIIIETTLKKKDFNMKSQVKNYTTSVEHNCTTTIAVRYYKKEFNGLIVEPLSLLVGTAFFWMLTAFALLYTSFLFFCFYQTERSPSQSFQNSMVPISRVMPSRRRFGQPLIHSEQNLDRKNTLHHLNLTPVSPKNSLNSPKTVWVIEKKMQR